MTDVKDRRILGVSCAIQLAALMAFYLIQHFVGYGFCLESRQCIVDSMKFLLINLLLSVLAGWMCSGAFVTENGSNPGSKSTRRKINSFIKAICITFCGSFIYHFITILYGAPFIKSMEETYLFSCSMALMTLFHLMLVSNGKWWSIFQILNFQLYKTGKIIDNAQLISFLTIVGALIGSAAIPLDWDRPWQAWPVPCSCGATVGYITGLMIFMSLPLAEYVKFKHERNKMKYY